MMVEADKAGSEGATQPRFQNRSGFPTVVVRRHYQQRLAEADAHAAAINLLVYQDSRLYSGRMERSWRTSPAY